MLSQRYGPYQSYKNPPVADVTVVENSDKKCKGSKEEKKPKIGIGSCKES